ncbi:alanine racemase [soil metagenome]
MKRAMDSTAARLTVDLDALAANHALLKELAGSAEVAPVVKADAYGLGAAAVSTRLWGEGARSFFTARLSEGVALRAILPNAEIWVLDGCPDGADPILAEHDLKPVLNSLDQIARFHSGGGGDAAIHIDTGMNRLGLRPEEAQALADAPDRLRGVEVEMVMSHLACASDPTPPMNMLQCSMFKNAAQHFPRAKLSLANSAGVFLGPDYAFDLVRPGVALYGGGPLGTTEPRLKTVATLELPILQLRTVRPGETVGYGATWTAPETRRLAILGGGYADGVLRSGSPGAYASLDGRRCAVIGRISMDLIALDVTDHPGAREGAYAQMIGPDAPIDDLATASGSLAYELLVRLAPRVQRRYVGAVG